MQKQTLPSLSTVPSNEPVSTLAAQVLDLDEAFRQHQALVNTMMNQCLYDNQRVCSLVTLMAKAMARIREISNEPEVQTIINEVAAELHRDWSQTHED